MRHLISFSNLFKSRKVTRYITVMSNEEKPKIVFVLGGPGAGKGTQCQNIVREFGFVHLSAGDLLRAEQNNPDSKYSELINDHMRRSVIVPVEITLNLLLKAMESNKKSKKFLIDGFPRSMDNLEGWNRMMPSKIDLLFVLFFDCDIETCKQRCLERGAKGSGRIDDNMQVIEKRMQVYLNDSMDVIKHYEKLHLVRRVEASKSPDQVFEDVKVIFQGL